MKKEKYFNFLKSKWVYALETGESNILLDDLFNGHEPFVHKNNFNKLKQVDTWIQTKLKEVILGKIRKTSISYIDIFL